MAAVVQESVKVIALEEGGGGCPPGGSNLLTLGTAREGVMPGMDADTTDPGTNDMGRCKRETPLPEVSRDMGWGAFIGEV